MKRGRFAADDVLVVNALVSKTTHDPLAAGEPAHVPKTFSGRLGVTIPKKAGTAVVRNQWKRLIREAFRLDQHKLPSGFDFVVKPKRGATPEFDAIRKSLRRLVARATNSGRGKRDSN